MLYYRYHILHQPFTLQYVYQQRDRSYDVTQDVYISRDYRENARQLQDAYNWMPEETWNELMEDLRERVPVGWEKWHAEFMGPLGPERPKFFVPSKMRRRTRHWNRAPHPNRSRNGH